MHSNPSLPWQATQQKIDHYSHTKKPLVYRSSMINPEKEDNMFIQNLDNLYHFNTPTVNKKCTENLESNTFNDHYE
jgi:hypothetical protein